MDDLRWGLWKGNWMYSSHGKKSISETNIPVVTDQEEYSNYLPVLMYACAAWNRKNKMSNKITVAEM